MIRPDEKIPIGHISHDPMQMQKVYLLGRKKGLEYIDRIIEFYKS